MNSPNAHSPPSGYPSWWYRGAAGVYRYPIVWKATVSKKVWRDQGGCPSETARGQNKWLLDSALFRISEQSVFCFLNTNPGVLNAKDSHPGQCGWIIRRADPDSRKANVQQTWQPAQAFRGGTPEMAFSPTEVWPWGNPFAFLTRTGLNCEGCKGQSRLAQFTYF